VQITRPPTRSAESDSARGEAGLCLHFAGQSLDCGIEFMQKALTLVGRSAIISTPQSAPAGSPDPAEMQRIWRSTASYCGLLIMDTAWQFLAVHTLVLAVCV